LGSSCRAFGPNPLILGLGFLFVPWTTLMYVLFWTANGLGLVGWIFVIVGFLGDIGTYGGGFLGNRSRVESYDR
jgi:hypothetical protein